MMFSSYKVDDMMGDWSALPQELLGLIFIRLRHAADIIRFGAVCTSWKLVAMEAKQLHLKPLSPMLLLPPNAQNEAHNLLDFSTRKACKIELPETEGAWCSTSWKGWLLTINFSFPYAMNLLNPISRLQIQLPPATMFEDAHSETEDTSIPTECFISKMVASSSPSDPNCIIMVIHSMWNKLAFCKPGDREWKTLKSGIYHFQDIIFYKGNFYATAKQEVGIVQCDLGPEPKVTPFAPPVWVRSLENKYLVESCGELLQVSRFLHYDDDRDEMSPYNTIIFEVFKLDFNTRTWIKVENLGDNSLFLGHSGTFSISTQDLLEFKKNCIYFLDDYLTAYYLSEFPQGCTDMGVFNLETRMVEPGFPTTQVWRTPLFWIIPDLFKGEFLISH
ncbi:putative F-box protein [Vitis vinifera]|uniref:Putative F-box protein n=1 Tax=Vitis vinifera TaxID=29760 RepID=A0A438JUK5_VITVI|nr:putative F-box protein [Vitis vinifera]